MWIAVWPVSPVSFRNTSSSKVHCSHFNVNVISKFYSNRAHIAVWNNCILVWVDVSDTSRKVILVEWAFFGKHSHSPMGRLPCLYKPSSQKPILGIIVGKKQDRKIDGHPAVCGTLSSKPQHLTGICPALPRKPSQKGRFLNVDHTVLISLNLFGAKRVFLNEALYFWARLCVDVVMIPGIHKNGSRVDNTKLN